MSRKITKPTQAMFADDELPIEQLEQLEQAKKAPQKRPTKPVEPQHEEIESPEVGGTGSYLELPSNGRLGYPRMVEYREIMVKDEEALALANEKTYGKTLNAVLKSILNDCDFYEDIALYERDYILIWIWANNYSMKKQVEVTCHSCGHKQIDTVDLTSLEVIDFKDSYAPLTIPLKNATLKSIDVRLHTVRDEMIVDDYLALNPNADPAIAMMVASIVLPFNIKFDAKMEWVRENVSSREMAVIKNFHRYYRFGVKDYIDHECSSCGEVTRGRIPFQAEDVLFPVVSTDFEELLRSS